MTDGWLGEKSQLDHVLRTYGAVMEDGKFLVRNSSPCFGIDGSVVVPGDCEFLTSHGQWINMAYACGTTSYGMRVRVF